DGGLDYCFEFDLAGAMLNAVNAGNTDGLGSKMDEVMSAYPYLQFGTFLTNHDMDRVMNVLAEDESKAKLAANLLLTLPGIPYLYYGEEIGMTGAKPDPDIRTPMHWDNSTHGGFTSGSPWRPVNADFPTKNIAAQQADSGSLWHTYRNLIAIRNGQTALRQGNYQPVESAAEPVFAFLRYTDQERVMVAANLEDSVQQDAALTLEFSGLPAGEYYLEELSSGEQFGLSVNSQGGFSGVDIGTLEPRSTKIFSLRAGPLSAAAAASAALKVTLFPNPANAQVNLRLAGATAGQVDYAVLNALGQAVSTGRLQQNQRDQTHVLNLQRLDPGFYLIRLNPEGQEPQSVRLLLQR
ncbi:MAG: alpha-amylase family glycosyl hydrolase, partial [Bacteroidota bacterium]